MIRTMLFVLIALAIYGVPAESAICVPPTVQKDSPYHYIASLTEALSHARAALDRATSPQPRPVSEVDLFVALKLGKADFDCARAQVSPYTTSSNDAIKTSAESTTVTFARLAQLSDRAVAEYKAILDSASEGKPLKQGSVAERQAELAVAYDEAWKLLIPSVIAGTYAVVEENPSTGRMSGLVTRFSASSAQHLARKSLEAFRQGRCPLPLPLLHSTKSSVILSDSFEGGDKPSFG